MLLPPGVQVKTIESDALSADGHLNDERADLLFEHILVHAQVRGRISETHDARKERLGSRRSHRASTAIDADRLAR